MLVILCYSATLCAFLFIMIFHRRLDLSMQAEKGSSPLRVQRYDIFLTYTNKRFIFGKKNAAFACICQKKALPLHLVTIKQLKKQSHMTLPANPDILVSFVNMKLRDEYASLEALCEDMDLNPDELIQNLRKAGYEYNEAAKRFW